MKQFIWVRLGLLVGLGVLLLGNSGAGQSRPAAFVPKFEALAETRLLMEGLAQANYRSVVRLLKKKPADQDTWVFTRGQALLIAETGNLLLLRPPRNTGRESWMKLAMAMRDEAGTLARHAGARDYENSKAALATLANACNRCHQTFRVPVRIAPTDEASDRATSWE